MVSGSHIELINPTNNSWLSLSANFAFGFLPLNSSGGSFLLAVWFNKLPNKTVVWSANWDRPVKASSKVEFTIDGGVVLYDDQDGKAWSPRVAGASYAAMLDTGNLVIVTADNRNYHWESFAEPTDTILPTHVLPLGSSIRSQLTPTNYHSGRFALDMQMDGNLVLYPVNAESGVQYDPYWATGTEGDGEGKGKQLVFNEMGYIYLALNNGSTNQLTPPRTGVPAKDYYQRAVLESDGVLRQYIRPKNNSKSASWSVLWQMPDNICTQVSGTKGSGVCGYNSYCRLDTTSNRPICECPPGYSPFDPNNMFLGCKLDIPLSCDPNEKVTLLEMPNVDWLQIDYERISPASETECQEACLKDCLCAAAVFEATYCWKKRQPLSNGRENASIAGKSFVKSVVLSLPQDSPRQSKERMSVIVVLSMLLVSCALLNTVLQLSKLCRRHRKSAIYVMDYGNSIRSFTYKELEAATGGFKEKLGRGSFGTVYKGTLGLDAKISIAVKKLDKVVEAGEEFRTEVSLIGQTHHKNLVGLIGFCDEGCHRLLVYEYMSNGSLASFLFGTTRPGWKQRAEMALEVARGLLYLHEECSSQIIHCDIKPQNVLLGDIMTAWFMSKACYCFLQVCLAWFIFDFVLDYRKRTERHRKRDFNTLYSKVSMATNIQKSHKHTIKEDSFILLLGNVGLLIQALAVSAALLSEL